MDGGDNWDLHAVVRGCCSTTTTATTAAASIFPFFTDPSIFLADFDVNDINNKYSSSDHFNFSLKQQEEQPFEEKNTTTFDQELHELFRPFFTPSARSPSPQPPPPPPHYQQPQPSPPPPPLSNVLQITQQKQPLHQVLKQQSHPPSHVNIPRSKRRKNQQKKVCQVPADSLSSDIWAWRKYGQKPIKGSPYPRGYYRCSSSKGCSARKQVERSRSDPGIFIVTYTAEHNHPAPTHRNSLAGSTRRKLSSTADQTISGAGDGSKSQILNVQINGPSSSSSSPSLELEDDQVFLPQMMIGTTCAVECKEETEDWVEEELGLEDDDEFGISEMQVAVAGDDDLIVDCSEVDQVLDGTTTRPEASVDSFPDLFPASFGGLSWTVNNAATAAGGI